MTARPADEKPSTDGSMLERLNVPRSLNRHRWIALILLLAVAGAGFPVAWIKGKPVYYTEAVIFVSPRFLRNLQEDKEFEMQSNSQYREYVQQNVRTVNRYDTVEEALTASPAFRSHWQLPNESVRGAIERLQGSLSVKPVPDTYQITVGLESDSREGLAEFLNNIVAVYLGKAKVEEFYASDTRIASLKKESDQLTASIDEKQEKRTALAQELGVSTFTDNYVNPYDRLLVSAKEGTADGRRKRIEAEAQLNMLEEKSPGEKKRAVEAFALDLASRDAAVTTVLATLNTRRGELMARASGLAENHPGRQAALKEIRDIDAEKQLTIDRLSASYVSMLLDQRRAEASRARQIEQSLNAEVEQQQSQASWFTRNYQVGIGLGLEITSARKRFDAIEDRTRFLAQEGRAPGFVRMFSAARPPEQPVRGGRKKIFFLFVAGALFLGLATPVAIDLLDPRVLSPGDAGRALGFPLMGWVPERTDTGEPFWREQILRLAHRIDQDRTTNGSRVWCFTAAQSGSGTTTMVTAVGKALADLGVPALTVEANAWRSDPRYRSDSRARGLSVVLHGNSHLADNIEPAIHDLPDRLPVGDLDGSGHLPDVHRLIEVLREAGSVYSAVLVDLPPILASVDAEYLAGRADVVVLVLEAVHLQRGELGRAVQALERNRPRAVAGILNRVRLEEGGPGVRRALDEFERGATAPAPRWRSPWTWG